MSAAAEVLVVAFQDAPALLAVRVSNPAAQAFAVRFANRRPDARPGGNAGSVGCLIVAGVIVAGVAMVSLRGCDGGGDGYSPPALSAVASADAGGSTAWKNGLAELAADWEPRREALRPWAVRTLLEVPRELDREGEPDGGWLKPACSPQEIDANRRAVALARLLRAAGEVAGTAVILDLPGPQAMAAAAGLAGDFEPVVAIDNLPHPQGVVPSAQTLAAAVYWRPVVAEARRRRGGSEPPCFVLEGERLAAYANQPERFDNRSAARLPDPATLAALGVRRVLYVRPQSGAVAEQDDLAELLAALPAAGIAVRHLGLDAVDEAPPAAEPGPERAPHNGLLHAWLWSAAGGRDATYRAQARPFAPGAAFDGGRGERARVLGLLAPDRTSSSGGWRWTSGGGSHRRTGSHRHGS
jgi:hypothetical protein